VVRVFRGSIAWCRRDNHETHETRQEKGHPQISQISTDQFKCNVFSIRDNLSNLWINPFVIRPASGGLTKAHAARLNLVSFLNGK
jgi:hypothetical protein